MSDERSSSDTSRSGIFMAGGFVGAFILFILRALPGFFAFVVGGLLLFFGYGILASKKVDDKFAGLVCFAAGALTILSKLPFFKHPAAWLLKAGAIALLVLAVWNGIKFVLSLRRG